MQTQVANISVNAMKFLIKGDKFLKITKRQLQNLLTALCALLWTNNIFSIECLPKSKAKNYITLSLF